MISRSSKPYLSTLVMLILAVLACKLPQTTSSTPTSLPITPPADQTSTSPAATQRPNIPTNATVRPTSVTEAAIHRIATHRVYGIAGFYDRQTGRSFIPRGVNYSILIPVTDHYENRLFAPGLYDPHRTQADFTALAAAGFNTVRIILDGCTSGNTCIGLENGEGLNPSYLDNIADLMNQAKEANLLLILASTDLPELGGYAALANQGANQNFASQRNVEYLTAAGIHAAQRYWTDLLTGLISRHAPLETILGWELQDEQYYQPDQPPFSLESGKVTPANGQSYNLADANQKQTLAVDGLRYYIEQLRQTILTYDSTALVTMGFFAPDAPNPWREGDERMVITSPLLKDSSLDFFDFHASPGSGLDLAQLAQNFGMDSHLTKPVLMGAVGAYTWTYPQALAGAIAVQDWIAASCDQGFSGWLYSSYFPVPAGLSNATWSFTDDQNTILKAISPNNQPDACATTVLPGRNLALGKPVTVSGSLPDQTPQMAVDGDPNNQWSAGAYPTQWIEIDLGNSFSIGEIRLTVGQWPAGETLHQLWVGTSLDAMQQIYEFSGRVYDYDVLSYIPPTVLTNIRYVRIVTTESPSWVSWREIEVFAPFPSTPTPIPEPTITPTP